MKITLNATTLNNRASGAKQRFIGIYNELFHLLSDDEFVVYEPIDCRMSTWFEGAKNVVFKQTPLLSENRVQRYFRGLTYWPSGLELERPDISEVFHLPLVKAPTGKTLLTIHDIRDLTYLKGVERSIYKKVLDLSFKFADHVITVSESMRNEILEYYPDLKISAIYNGVDLHDYETISEEDLLVTRQKFSLPESFLLSVGHFEKRKNYINLISAVNNLIIRGVSTYLVIIGNDSGELAIVKEKIQSLGLSKYVRILTGLTDLEVRCIYKLCGLFVFPSSYEGFGIPVIEAMAAKCPMVLSDIPVFREITQDQGVYFLQNDPESIANTIEQVLSSSAECTRLIQFGSERVKDFSYQSIAKDLNLLYRSLL